MARQGDIGARTTQAEMLHPTALIRKGLRMWRGGSKSHIRLYLILHFKPQDVVKLHRSFYFVSLVLYHKPLTSDNRCVGSMTVPLSIVVVLDTLAPSRKVGNIAAS
jgi:hypothetical protein